jgi:phosphopantetheinyl transferase
MLRSFWKEGTLAYEKTGKPVLIGSAAQCSISHTAGGVFCVLLEEDGRACAPIGADAETAGRFDAARRAALAKRWFTEAEQELLAAAGGDEATFLRIWTGKEALVKRNGRGLAGIREADTTAVADQGLRLTVVTPGNTVLTVATAAEAETETSIECVEW